MWGEGGGVYGVRDVCGGGRRVGSEDVWGKEGGVCVGRD